MREGEGAGGGVKGRSMLCLMLKRAVSFRFIAASIVPMVL